MTNAPLFLMYFVVGENELRGITPYFSNRTKQTGIPMPLLTNFHFEYISHIIHAHAHAYSRPDTFMVPSVLLFCRLCWDVHGQTRYGLQWCRYLSCTDFECYRITLATTLTFAMRTADIERSWQYETVSGFQGYAKNTPFHFYWWWDHKKKGVYFWK